MALTRQSEVGQYVRWQRQSGPQTRLIPQFKIDFSGRLSSRAISEVEIDPDTGTVVVVAYTAVDDVGKMLNETIVRGQIHGGVAQGLGAVLGEQVLYDEDGQLLTASLMDYPLPRADQLPFLSVHHLPIACTTNSLGVKGAGEPGVAGALPSAANAVLDALASRGITSLDLPMTTQRVWLALHRANSQAARTGSP